jgi:hypothetical protein
MRVEEGGLYIYTLMLGSCALVFTCVVLDKRMK